MPTWFAQFLRFAVVGLISNAALYLAYLGLTHQGLGPKPAMTVTYLAGVLQTFVFNRRWTFDHDGPGHSALLRYATVYALGYFFNLAALYLLVGRLGMPHEGVQAGAIIGIAVFTFVLQRYWVFRPAG
jgi:putative flippase GtrA